MKLRILFLGVPFCAVNFKKNVPLDLREIRMLFLYEFRVFLSVIYKKQFCVCLTSGNVQVSTCGNFDKYNEGCFVFYHTNIGRTGFQSFSSISAKDNSLCLLTVVRDRFHHSEYMDGDRSAYLQVVNLSESGLTASEAARGGSQPT